MRQITVTSSRRLLELLETVEKQQFLVADKENTNKDVADLARVPFIGCAGHRMNLAVDEFLNPYEPLLEKIYGLIKKMSGIKNLAKWRLKTELRPVLRNKSQSTSTFTMVDTFLVVKDFIDPSDVELASLLPTPQERKTIQNLFESLKDFHSVTLALEKSDMNLHKACNIFNLVKENCNIMESYCRENAFAIKHSREGSAKVYLEKMA